MPLGWQQVRFYNSTSIIFNIKISRLISKYYFVENNKLRNPE